MMGMRKQMGVLGLAVAASMGLGMGGAVEAPPTKQRQPYLKTGDYRAQPYHSSGTGRAMSQPKRRKLRRGVVRSCRGNRK